MTVDLLSSDIFRNAMIAGTLAAVVCSLVGYFVVLRAQAFAAESLLDVCFAGATGAALFGVSPVFGMAVFGLGAALGIGAMGERARERSVEIGMVVSFALGVGVLFLGIYARGSASHANAGVAILFGSLLSIRPEDLLIVGGTGCLSIAGLAVLFRPLLFSTVDLEAARARGVPVRLVSSVFLALVALAAAGGAMAVGVLLAASLLVAPAAAAVRLARRPGDRKSVV
jgi:zinc/manganese transport system permease protein